MKRFITLLLALIMALSLCACGSAQGTKENVRGLEFSVPTNAEILRNEEQAFYYELTSDNGSKSTFWLGYNDVNQNQDFGTAHIDMLNEAVRDYDPTYEVTDTKYNTVPGAKYSVEIYYASDKGEYALAALVSIGHGTFLIQETRYGSQSAMMSAYNSIKFEKYAKSHK